MRKGFVVESWVCFEHSTQIPRCFTLTPRFFVSEFWVCCRVMGFFRTFHTHTHTHHDALRPPKYFLFPSFGFVVEFWVCFEHSTHTHTYTPRCFTPTLRFVSSFGFAVEFWTYFEHSTHTQDDALRPTHDFFSRVLGLLSSFRFVSNISQTHHDASRPYHDFFISEFWVWTCSTLIVE